MMYVPQVGDRVRFTGWLDEKEFCEVLEFDRSHQYFSNLRPCVLLKSDRNASSFWYPVKPRTIEGVWEKEDKVEEDRVKLLMRRYEEARNMLDAADRDLVVANSKFDEAQRAVDAARRYRSNAASNLGSAASMLKAVL